MTQPRACMVDGCARAHDARGYCAYHYDRIVRRESRGPTKPKSVQVRFWSSVDKTGSCWIWTGYLDHEGYGHCRSIFRTHIAHRVAWILTHGAISQHQPLDHTCLNRACVRPEHLRLVTPKQNSEHRQGANVNSASGVRGVTQHKNGRWRGTIGHNRRVVHVGYFATVAEAEAAVKKKRAELFTHDDAA